MPFATSGNIFAADQKAFEEVLLEGLRRLFLEYRDPVERQEIRSLHDEGVSLEATEKIRDEKNENVQLIVVS